VRRTAGIGDRPRQYRSGRRHAPAQVDGARLATYPPGPIPRDHRVPLKRISAACNVIAVLVAACDTSTPRAPDAVAVAERTAGTFVGGVVCSVTRLPLPLPDGLRESSGLALSGADPALLWSHNDRGNQPVLMAIDSTGRLVRSVAVQGADLIDWEDMEARPCESGTCLYIADIGDNEGIRESIDIYVVPEPADGLAVTAPAIRLAARYPEGPRDAESIFVHPTGDLFVITKGRPGPITLYRYPTPLRPDSSVLLERVMDLASEPLRDDDRATAASLSPDGRWLGMRTYRNLFIYDAEDLLQGRETAPAAVDLTPLGEPQGEGLAIGDDGTVWLSSEGSGGGSPPTLSRLSCSFPSARVGAAAP